jgi:hypothetical protein
MAFANDCLDTIGVCPNAVPVVQAGQCTESCQELKLVDPRSGVPIDLTQFHIGGDSSESPADECPVPSMSSSSFSSSSSSSEGELKHGVEIIAKELPNSSTALFAIMAEIDPAKAAEGIIRIPITAAESAYAGVWCAMAIIWQHGVQRRLFPFYFDVTPNLRAYNPSGPITMAEVRMAVRDVCPEMNFLLDAVEFKDEEIAWAIRRPIDYWNEIPPPIGLYSPVNFPYRYHWMEAVIGELLRMVAHWLRRNDLDYSAAGLTVRDTSKWPDYMKMGQERLQAWQVFVKNKKIEKNIAGGFASLGGYYPGSY